MIASKKTILGILGDQPTEAKMLVDRQDTEDIIDAILNKHDACKSDYDKIAYLFDGGTVPEVCKRLFDFCRDNLQYVVERTKAQYTSKPSTMLSRGYADCKGYALFIGGVLDALKRQGEKINWAFRFASYNLLKKKPYHVFIVVFYNGSEIYVDPVFPKFDYRYKPAMWLRDYSMNNQSAQIAGMYCDTSGGLQVLSDGNTSVGDLIGTTTAQYGASIQKLAPALAAIPVAAIALEAFGTALAIFGDKHVQGPDIRWLIQLYQYFVLGQAAVTSDNKVNEALKNDTWAWFAYVCGVPVYSRSAFNCLKTGHEEGKQTNLDAAGRAGVYIRITGNPGGSSLADITAAAQIAASLDYKAPAGGWKNQTPAPSVIDKLQGSATPGLTTTAPKNSLASLGTNKWLLFAIIGAGIAVLYQANKKPNHARKRT